MKKGKSSKNGKNNRSVRKIAIATSVLVISALVSTPVQAINLLQNGSFEDTDGTFIPRPDGGVSLNPSSTIIPGWTTINGELAWLNNNNSFGIITPYDSFFLDLAGYLNTAPYGGVTQTINTIAGQNYTLSLSLGIVNPTYPGPISVTATAGSSSQNFTFNASGVGNQWGNFSFDFAATSALTPISIVGVSTANGFYIGLDNVSVESRDSGTIPEPSSVFGLLGLGAFGIGAGVGRKFLG